MKSKLIILLFISIICVIGCTENDKNKQSKTSPYSDIINFQETAVKSKKDTINIPKIEFDTQQYDFGSVLSGEKVEYVYTFTNTGQTNLLILDTQSSCGCTIPEYSEAPILPGRKGEIKLVFDTTGKKDDQEKKVTIFTNTNPNIFYLTIKGQVISK